jgi:hypothetical protein
MNMQNFSKFINIHYNEYLYNYLNRFYFLESLENKKISYDLLNKRFLNSVFLDKIYFFNFQNYIKERNLKYMVSRNISKINKIDLFHKFKTKLPYLKKSLVYPIYFMAISKEEEEEKEKANKKKLFRPVKLKSKILKKFKKTNAMEDLLLDDYIN